MLAGIILTDSYSHSKGSPLAIMPWGEETFLQAITAKMKQAEIMPLFAILGSAFPQVRNHCRSCGTLAIRNEAWLLGPLVSLQIAARRIPPRAAGAMVARIGQPHIRVETFAEVAQVARKFPGRLILPTHENRWSYPFVVSRVLLPALMAMPRHSTIHNFVDQFAIRQLRVPVMDAFIHYGIESPEDLLLAREKVEWSKS